MAKFAVGDVVLLQRAIEVYPKGTMGVIARVDDSGWIKVIVDNSHESRYIMTHEQYCDLKKI